MERLHQSELEMFFEYFEIVEASSEELKLESYKLRYQVYCIETGFEDETVSKAISGDDGKTIYYEQDEFDSRSLCCLIRRRKNGQFAGTTRLILPDVHHLEAKFPIETHCILERKINDPLMRIGLGEVSRFAISKDFKRSRGEHVPLAVNSEGWQQSDFLSERRVLPHITLGLIAGLLRMSRENNIEVWWAVMEPSLIRLLQRYGIFFNPIGPFVNYRGTRLPSEIYLEEMLFEMQRSCFNTWDFVTNSGEFA